MLHDLTLVQLGENFCAMVVFLVFIGLMIHFLLNVSRDVQRAFAQRAAAKQALQRTIKDSVYIQGVLE
jgi:uncharacterized membrane protein